ncbi:MAG: FecR family protein [Opitutaceae bacterium]
MSDFGEKRGREELDEAAAWVIREDRGLSAGEQDRLSQWLAADPAHREAWARQRRNWRRMEPLARWLPEPSAEPNPDLLAPSRRKRRWWRPSLALAASVALILAWRSGWETPPVPEASAPAAVIVREASATRQLLEDGSVVEFNRGAEFAVRFTAAERRIELGRGEAHFKVVRDAARPFVVAVGGREVRAVGTAFNVRLDHGDMEVLVTEGRVRIDGATESAPRSSAPAGNVVAEPVLVPVLEAGQRAVIPVTGAGNGPRIATLTSGEIERVLAWQHRMLEFTAAPLEAVVAEFNRTNRLQLSIAEAGIAEVRLSASFRSDNVEGFVRLLEVGFGIRGERRGEREITLRRTR